MATMRPCQARNIINPDSSNKFSKPNLIFHSCYSYVSNVKNQILNEMRINALFLSVNYDHWYDMMILGRGILYLIWQHNDLEITWCMGRLEYVIVT